MITVNNIEFDASKKDAIWFQKLLWDTMPRKRWLIDVTRANNNRSWARGIYDTTGIKEKVMNSIGAETTRDRFKKPNDGSEKANESLKQAGNANLGERIDFTPLAIFNNYRQILINEIAKQNSEINCYCYDSSITGKKDEDIKKKEVEQLITPIFNKLSQKLGTMPPKGFPQQDESGQPQYSSDMSSVDALGLNMSNPNDVKLFQDVFQRQHFEVALENGVNRIFELSDIPELRKEWVSDYIECCAIAARSYVEALGDGLPAIKRVAPEYAFTINGRRKDRRDADGMGYWWSLSVREFLDQFGNQLTDSSGEISEDKLKMILLASNQQGGAYTNYYCNGCEPSIGVGGYGIGWCDWNTFMSFTINVGYLTVKSQNMTIYETKKKYGVDVTEKKDAAYKIDKKKKDGVSLENRFYETTYEGYYLMNNYTLAFGFREVPESERKGTSGQITDFPMQVYVENDIPLAERCIPFMRIIFQMWCKYQHWINKAKDSGYYWNIDAVWAVAEKMKNEDGTPATIDDLVRVLHTQSDGLYANVEAEDGGQVGGDGKPFHEIKRGLEETIKDIANEMQRQAANISEITGINKARIEANPQPNEGFKVTALQIQRSQETTYFIEDGIRKFLCNIGNENLWYLQWIIFNKAQGYEALCQMLGDDTVKQIEYLGEQTKNVFGLEFEVPLTDKEREEIKQWTVQLAAKGAITSSMMFQINDIHQYKKAAAILTYFERQQADKIAQQQAATLAAPMQVEQMKGQNSLAEIKMKGEYELAKQKLANEGLITVENIKVSGKVDAITTKAQTNLLETTHKAEMNTDAQKETMQHQALIDAVHKQQDHQNNLELQPQEAEQPAAV